MVSCASAKGYALGFTASVPCYQQTNKRMAKSMPNNIKTRIKKVSKRRKNRTLGNRRSTMIDSEMVAAMGDDCDEQKLELGGNFIGRGKKKLGMGALISHVWEGCFNRLEDYQSY